jgi:Ni/Fe-hydrogenase 1 B-type cytochrome subunit
MAIVGIHPAEEVVANGVPHEIHDEPLQPTYVWDVVVRVTHWLIMLSMILLAVTGVYIGRPWGAAGSGPAGQHFAMGWARVLHAYGAIAFTLAVLSRIVWMFMGPRRSGWRQFIPTSSRRLRDLKSTFLFYTFLRDRPPRTLGHNPLAGLTYVFVFGLYLVMIATGFALYSISSHSFMKFWQFLLPMFHGAQSARWLHHVSMWLLIGFVVHHVYSAILTSRVEKNGAIDSMFSGYKFLPKDMPHDDE